jgi:hypothetical protein
LIAPDIVLSAAHCNINGAPNRMLVGAYKSDTASSGGVYRNIVEKVQHPLYGNNNNIQDSNDFLLIKLNQPVTSVFPVQLSINEDGSKPATGNGLTVVGLGSTTEGGNGPNNGILREVVVQAISTSQCQAQYGSGSIDGTMFCACK